MVDSLETEEMSFSRQHFTESRATLVYFKVLRGNMKTKILGLVLLLALPLVAFAQDEEEVTASPAEELFIDAASQNDIYALDASRLAIITAEDPAVQEFAQSLIESSTRSTVELLPLASDLSYSPTSTASPAQSILASHLTSLTGAEFDSSYLEGQISALTEAITLFELSSENVTDEALGAYLDETLAALQEHLSAAEALADTAD